MDPVPIAFDKFAARAREYCDLLENAEGTDPWSFVTRLQSLLPKLYAAAIELPYPDPWPTKMEATDHSPGPGECATLLKRLSKLLPVDSYWTTLEPLAPEDAEIEVISASLSEDLADVYHDLTQGIRMLDRSYPRERAQFLWKHYFMSHWGEKLVEALRMLHVVSFDLGARQD